ncbi:MAG: GAF domain-containing protein [Deltaproteobacteria bacterium]|nr:GAF domain-containing protein [Deltaproteobacteria bacterium]
MSETEKVFHARIFRIYLDFLRHEKNWTETQIEDFLSSLSISQTRLYDDSTWFDLKFSDEFYFALVKATGDENLAFKAGLFISKNSYSPVIHQLIRGLMNVSTVYKLTSRFADHFSKAAALKVKESHSESAILEATPYPGIQERPYMCENRKGILSGVTKVFGLALAEVSESECMHKGGKNCRYHIRWKQKSKAASVIPLLLLNAIFSTFFFLKEEFNFAICLSLSTLILSFFLRLKRQSKLQRRELLDQNEFLDTSLKENQIKNKQLQMVSQISQLTHAMTSPEELSRVLVKSVCEILDYDRAILLTSDLQKQVLKVAAFHGFSKEMEDLLSETEFHLNSENTSGFFVRVVNTKSPVLMTDVEKEMSQLSGRSQKFAKVLGAKSFVAVPLTDAEKNVIGVLAVDYTTAHKKMGIADQDLLMTLADHQAIAFQNANLVDQLKENLEISRKISSQQQHLRETFQKFVPTDLAQDLVNSSEGDLYSRLLSRVQKKSASILFCDIFNFSTLSESMHAENIVDLVNTVFGALEPIISKHSGFVDKFTGDGFIAVFEDPESCLKACEAARQIQMAMTKVNELLFEKAYPKISVGVGINYGQTIFGNVGSVDRLNFTVMGETVNLAARLESHTRQLGVGSICLSSAVFQQIKISDREKFEFIDLGMLTIKGYRENIHAYQMKPFENLSASESSSSETSG